MCEVVRGVADNLKILKFESFLPFDAARKYCSSKRNSGIAFLLSFTCILFICSIIIHAQKTLSEYIIAHRGNAYLLGGRQFPASHGVLCISFAGNSTSFLPEVGLGESSNILVYLGR